MRPAPSLLLFLATAALVFLGLALGSQSQEERFLGPEDESIDYGAQPQVAGNLIPFTAVLCAAGAGLGGALLSRRPTRQRLRGAFLVAGGTWVLVSLLQTANTNYQVLVESRFARMSVSPFLLDEAGLASVLLPVFALIAAGFYLIGSGAWALLASPAADRRPTWRGHVARSGLATAFLLVAALAALHLLVVFPTHEPSYGLALVVLPLLAAAALMEVVVLQIRTWRLAECLAEPRLRAYTAETWRALGRVEIIAFVMLVVAILGGTLLPRTEITETTLGKVLILSVRSVVQGTVFLAIPLLPAWRHARRVQDWLAREDHAPAGRRGRPRDAIVAFVVAGVTLALVAITSITSQSALAPWSAALIPIGVHTGFLRREPAGVVAPLLAAAALWGKGNTLAAEHNPDAFSALEFVINPGVLAFWRIAAVILVAWAVATLARIPAGRTRGSLAFPLAFAVGFCTAVIIWLQFSFNAWIVPSSGSVDPVAIGNLIRSVPHGLRIFLQLFGAALAVLGALALARLVRPDWFRRGGQAVEAPVGQAITPT